MMFALLMLQGCQPSEEAKDQINNKNPQLDEAATYNAQLGLAYLKQGDRARAKRKLFLALSQAPKSPNAHASMAYFMEQCGSIGDAHLYYKKAIALSHSSGSQLNNYGAFLCRQGQYRQAEQYFLKAVKDMEYEHTAGAYENAGLCVMAIPDEKKAALYFAKALEQDPSREQALYELADIEIKQGHHQDALTLLQKFPNLSLNDKTLLSMAANMAHKTGKIDLEAEYQTRIHNFVDKTGEKNEYNSSNG